MRECACIGIALPGKFDISENCIRLSNLLMALGKFRLNTLIRWSDWSSVGRFTYAESEEVVGSL